MKRQNADALERIKTASDEEIRQFVASEKERLGPILKGFTISWAESETQYQLELYSEADSRNAEEGHPWPYGQGFNIGEIQKSEDGREMFEVVPRAGRAFYFLWKQEIMNLKRDLGGYPF